MLKNKIGTTTLKMGKTGEKTERGHIRAALH